MHELLEAQARRLRRLQKKQSARALAVTKDALAKIQRRLSQGVGPWDQAAHNATRRLLAHGISELATQHTNNLQEVLPEFGRLSWEDTSRTLKTLDRRYTGSVRPLRFDALEWLETNSEQLSRVRLQEYRRSFARYGAGAVRAVEDEIARTVLVGEPWNAARRKVWDAVRDVVGDRQWMVDRIIRTESASFYNGTRLAALIEEDSPEDPMYKRLVATFDELTGADSKILDGQIRPVREPFYDPMFGKHYMAPPNRPHDREIVVGWRARWGDTYEGPDAVSVSEQGGAKTDPIRDRKRALRKQIRALDQNLAALALASTTDNQSSDAQRSVLDQRKRDLVRELSTLEDEEAAIKKSSRITPAHITMLVKVSLGQKLPPFLEGPRGRIRTPPLLDDLLREGLVQKRRSRRGKVGYVLTAAGTLALTSHEFSQKTPKTGLTTP